jgi:hypothetical protein
MSRGYVSSLRVSFIRWSFDKIGGSVDLTKALESATADCTSTQAQSIIYLNELRDLRGKLDEIDACVSRSC